MTTEHRNWWIGLPHSGIQRTPAWTVSVARPILQVVVAFRSQAWIDPVNRLWLVVMRMFKKLQENSLYWRYRFIITRRWLALKRWNRERRQPRAYQINRVRYRAVASANPFTRSGFDSRRGIAFVLILAAVLTLLQTTLTSLQGLSFGLVFLAVVIGLTYIFARFW